MKKHFLILFMLASFFSTAVVAQNASTTTAAAQVPAKTTVEWKTKNIDLGKVPQGVPAKVEFEFKNTGKNPLIISHVSTSCGCTVASYPKEPIAPGKKSTIVGTYNAAVPGEFHKTLTVSYNGEEEMVLLNLSGTVEAAPAKDNTSGK